MVKKDTTSAEPKETKAKTTPKAKKEAPKKRSQSAKFDAVEKAATDPTSSIKRRQTRSQTKKDLKKAVTLTRGKEESLDRSKSNLSALVEAK